jgi:hypothetical protein
VKVAGHLQLGEADVDAVEKRRDLSGENQGNQPPGDPGERRLLERLIVRRVDALVPRLTG